MKFLKKHLLFFLNILVVVGVIILPYILFQGKYYISGDDTRLYYIYPWEYFVEFTFSSWHHFSSVGANGPTQFMIPFLLVWSFLDFIIPSKLVLAYMGFSLPIVLGFLSLQVFIKELLPKKNIGPEAFLGALFFIFSPITISNQYFIFLSTIWLLPLIPIIGVTLLRYIKTGKLIYIAASILFSCIFSMGLFSIPWVLGFMLPIVASYVVISFSRKNLPTFQIIRRAILFFVSLAISQTFWFFPFIMTYLGGSEVNFGSKVFSKVVSDTFTPTVLATATGNILYPLFNLFHRQIAFDSNWQLKYVFSDFFDKTIFINIIFVALLFFGIFAYKKTLGEKDKFNYLVILLAFVIALFLFTVNIGPLKNIFLAMGQIPGFVMFRNFYDKLALSYIILYAILISFSFYLLKLSNKKIYGYAIAVFVVVVLLNATQIGKILNAPLWLTRDTGRNIMIPEEYTDFLGKVGKTIPSSNNIFTMPFGTAIYSVIKDVDSDNVYTGTSPVKLFSGINDISGFLSFYFSEANSIIETMIVNREYKGLSNILYTYNVNYVFYNKNIPQDVLNTWVFDKRMNRSLDKNFMNTYFEEKPLVVSTNGNYLLYKLKKTNNLLSAKNISFKKINETKFKLYVKNIKKDEKLIFSDSYHVGWKLFVEKNPTNSWCEYPSLSNGVVECREDKKFLEGDELSYSFRKPIFSQTHKPHSQYFTNEWVMSMDTIKNNLDKSYYQVNADGSVNIEMVLYFVPQNYFYFGSFISVIVIGSSLIYVLSKVIKKEYSK